VAWGELIGGIALLVGLLTRLSAAAMIAIQVGAIATVTWARGFSFAAGGGYEYNLALLGMCVALLLTGGGYYSVDRCLTGRRGRPHTPPG
jgi:putative oxidoreductase